MSKFSAMINTVKLPFILTLLVLSYGCTHYYVPQQYPLKPDMAPEFSSTQNIDVVNAQTTPNIVLMATQGAHKYMGDLQLWTDTAVGLLKSELEKRGVTTTDVAPKKIRLKITDANIYFGSFSFRCILALEVETSEGLKKTFKGNNTSPWSLYRACDGAVTMAIAEMLNDNDILNFIKY